MKKIINWILVTAIAISCILSAACTRSSGDPELVVELYENSWIMEHYMGSVKEYDHVIWEQYYYEWGSRSLGPTEYSFRGIVYLTDEEAARLKDAYEWHECDAPDLVFEQIDPASAGEGPWYSCDQFEIDNYPALLVSYAVFDGEKIVFDVSQT